MKFKIIPLSRCTVFACCESEKSLNVLTFKTINKFRQLPLCQDTFYKAVHRSERKKTQELYLYSLSTSVPASFQYIFK